MPPLSSPSRVERDDGIDRFPVAGVVLAHGDEPRPLRIEDHVGVAQRTLPA